MALANYARTCGRNVPGNLDKVYFIRADYIDTVTLTSGEVSAITTKTVNSSPEEFKQYQTEVDGVQFTSEGGGKTNYAETQNLVLMFSKKDAGLITAKESLIEGVTCGLVAIRVDSNGEAFLSGYSAVEGTGRPYNQIACNFDSGRLPTDEEGQMYTITLTRISGYDEIPFDDDLTAAITGGSATFIDWPA